MDPLDERLSGFEVDLRECDGHDLDSLRNAIGPQGNRPSVVIMNTIKGNGVSDFAGTMRSHYLPLNELQYNAAIEASMARQ
jgi:transketolase